MDTFADARDRDILNLAEEMEHDLEADKLCLERGETNHFGDATWSFFVIFSSFKTHQFSWEIILHVKKWSNSFQNCQKLTHSILWPRIHFEFMTAVWKKNGSILFGNQAIGDWDASQ